MIAPKPKGKPLLLCKESRRRSQSLAPVPSEIPPGTPLRTRLQHPCCLALSPRTVVSMSVSEFSSLLGHTTSHTHSGVIISSIIVALMKGRQPLSLRTPAGVNLCVPPWDQEVHLAGEYLSAGLPESLDSRVLPFSNGSLQAVRGIH